MNMTMEKPPGLGRVTASLILVVAAACQAPPPPAAPDHSVTPAGMTAPADPTLQIIMHGLETDMAAVAHGLWVGDREAIAVAAGRLADHPHVTPDEMRIIQTTLVDEFAAFAGHDQAVHGLSVALAAAAAGDGDADLLAHPSPWPGPRTRSVPERRAWRRRAYGR